MTSDEENLLFADNQADVDALNAKFYGSFPYPWPPAIFEAVTDASLFTHLLAQDIGDWRASSFHTREMRIWVAGCGTNQAVFTALKFPNAKVIGSDLSAPSLELAEKTAKGLGLTNLTLRRESLNEVTYNQEFDYVICTGVIHHNADPAVPLTRLSAAVKPSGVMELMVYNRYHRALTTAFQNAMRILTGGATDFREQLSIAQKIIKIYPADNSPMWKFLKQVEASPEAAFADALLQPVEHSYTVRSFNDLLMHCNLTLVGPCVNQFDKATDRYLWELDFKEVGTIKGFDTLTDLDRWQVVNLLRAESSPMLWFYVQRSDSGRSVKTMRQLNDEFQETRWTRIRSESRRFVRDEMGTYRLQPNRPPFPATAALRGEAKEVYDKLDPTRPVGDTLRKLGISPSFYLLNSLRLGLTTSAFPYLRAA